MSDNVLKLIIDEGQPISEMLRNIADDIDNGEFEFDNLTIIGGTEVFHLGDSCDARS